MLEEILEERVPWRPGRQYPRAVKRKPGKYPTRSQATPVKKVGPRLYQVEVGRFVNG